MAYFMSRMTVKEMKEALEKTKTVIIPTGVVEQHGYHLTLATDIHNATRPLEIAADRLNAQRATSRKQIQNRRALNIKLQAREKRLLHLAKRWADIMCWRRKFFCAKFSCNNSHRFILSKKLAKVNAYFSTIFIRAKLRFVKIS